MSEDNIRCSVYYRHKKIAAFKNGDLFAKWLYKSKYFDKKIDCVVKSSHHVVYNIIGKQW